MAVAHVAYSCTNRHASHAAASAERMLRHSSARGLMYGMLSVDGTSPQQPFLGAREELFWFLVLYLCVLVLPVATCGGFV